MALKEALFYEKLEGQKVLCTLCAHRCVIRNGRPGVCGVRINREGTLYTLVGDNIVSRAVDPIEKKPLFHFLPGTRSYSIATVGCNFRCFHCQNFEISQALKGKRVPRESEVLCPSLGAGVEARVLGEPVTPRQIVDAALATGCQSISYTYTEPTIFYELAYETARLATRAGIYNVFVTNGYITREALEAIRPYLHAANVDLKAFTEEHYKKVCGATLQPVLDAIRWYKELGIWIEVTTLVIPGHNDSEEELRRIAAFIKSVGEDIPWHVTQFYPTYKMLEEPPTPVDTLRRARQIGLEEGLRYVYEGNVPGEGGESTYCYRCGALLIGRYGYRILQNRLQDGCCPQCGAVMDGIWDPAHLQPASERPETRP